MQIAVTSTVVFAVPDTDDVEGIRRRFLAAHRAVIGDPMKTVSGQVYVLLAIERLEVEPREP